MDIKITVADKRCTVQGAPVIVCGNSGYTVTFTFDAEWDQAGKKTARFTYVRDGKRQRTDVELTGNTVNVPAVYRTMELQVGVYAGDLVTSTPARIPCEKSIVCDSCGPDDLFPGQVVQIERDLIDKTCPSFADSGEIVSCTPVKGHPMEVVSHIVPKQSGSGDPSPSNIRPITGYDSITLSRTGKNLLPYPYYDTSKTVNGLTFTVHDDGSITIKGTATANTSFRLAGNGSGVNATPLPIWIVPGETYYLKPQNAMPSGARLLVYFYDEANQVIGSISAQAYNSGTVPATTVKYWAIISINSGVSIDQTIYPTLNRGSTAVDFEPYKGGTFNIDLGQTVYGGTFNWKTGELTIDRETLVFDGVNIRFDWFGNTNGNAFGFRRIKPSTTWESLCSHLKAKFMQTYGDIIITDVNADGLMAYDQHFTSEQEANTWLAEQYANGTPFTVCYELKTPVTIQLTPQEILALSGTNCLSSNTGDTEVSGKADPAAIIADLYDKINKLQAAAVNNA